MKIRRFSIAFYFLDDESSNFHKAIIDFADSIKYPAGFSPKHLIIEYQRPEIKQDELKEEEFDDYDALPWADD